MSLPQNSVSFNTTLDYQQKRLGHVNFSSTFINSIIIKTNATAAMAHSDLSSSLLLFHQQNNSSDNNSLFNTISSQQHNHTMEFTFECFAYKLTTDIKFAMLSLMLLLVILADVVANMVVLTSIVCFNGGERRKRVDTIFMSNAIADLIMGKYI
jgi:hypothetical protein